MLLFQMVLATQVHSFEISSQEKDGTKVQSGIPLSSHASLCQLLFSFVSQLLHHIGDLILTSAHFSPLLPDQLVNLLIVHSGSLLGLIFLVLVRQEVERQLWEVCPRW